MEGVLTILDLDRLRSAPLRRDPFDFVVVDEFIRREELPLVVADFPDIRGHGSYPADLLKRGPAFERLLAALTGSASGVSRSRWMRSAALIRSWPCNTALTRRCCIESP